MLNSIVSSELPAADQVTIRENKLTLVERLADDLAHEIKNPLHSIVINLEVLRRRITRLEADRQEELLRYTTVLSSELDRVNRRVDLLLRMVRPNRDSDEPTTFSEILEELRELVELECERHRVQLRIDVPSAYVRARLPKASTRQIILSLILKTLDSVPPGGALHLAAEDAPGWVELHFEGLDTQGRRTTPAHPLEDGSYFAVARALAERLGGHLDVVTASEPIVNGSAAESCFYVLALPAPPENGPLLGNNGHPIG